MQRNNILSRLPGATQILSTLCTLAFAAACPAPDLERNRRPAEQTVDVSFDGEPLMLNAAGHQAKPGAVTSDRLDKLFPMGNSPGL
jgi:hypothetical protein